MGGGDAVTRGGRHRTGVVRSSAAHPPQPPTDKQKYAYYTGQRRWLFAILFAAFCGVQVGIVRLSLHNVWTSALMVLVVFNFAVVGISLRSSSRKRRLSLAQHKQLVADYYPGPYLEDWPSVDVFLPSAGEDLRVLGNTFVHVSRLDWPGPLTVYVLDDSARPEVHELAAKYGFTYLTRPNRGHLKKAGNLFYGYQHSTGDLIHATSLRART